MNKFSDYQWPQSLLKKAKFIENLTSYNNKNLIHKIEGFFEKKFKIPVRLFPSARSCIGSILEFEKINRNDEVYVNKWVSNCIFNTIGYFSNSTVNFGNQRIFIANNIWGLNQKLKILKSKKIIIDDSSDSIILKPKYLFPNNSKYEIFSLPKLIGSVSGGIVISKDKKFLKFCKIRQKKNKNFGIVQSKLKFDEINKKKTFFDYRYKEAVNSYCEYNGLIDIKENFVNFELNKAIILYRSKLLKKIVNFRREDSRIGPVALIDTNLIKNIKNLEKIFMFRHKLINLKKNYSKKFLLFPLHFMIKNKRFNFYLNILKKNLKK